MRITLIGMPGSGKSFIGEKLAHRLGCTFVDIDKEIEHEFDLSLQEVVDRLGNDAFLDKEAKTTIENTGVQENIILSTGGSVVYREATMMRLKECSVILYLEVPLSVLKKRIGSTPRGIVIAKDKTFADLYAERTPLYEKFADYTLKGNRDPEVIVETILDTLNLRASASSGKTSS